MLKIRNVTAKNFMSIGNNTQAVNFENCELTLVLGNNLDLGSDGNRNGTGKTTIINALSFALYGEAITNIKRDNLINLTNGKQMLVTVEFEVDGCNYRIERGRRPGLLKWEKNGDNLRTKVDDESGDEQQGDSRETQKEIDRVLGFSHIMFKHLIALNTYSEPFLSMSGPKQREMIEQLLGITDLSLKADVLSTLLKETRDNIKTEEFRIKTVTESNSRIETNIADMIKKSTLWQRNRDEKLASMCAEVLALQEIDIDAEVENVRTNLAVDEASKRIRSLEDEMDRIDVTLRKSKKRLSELENNLQHALDGTCPACGQDTAHLGTHAEYTAGVVQKIADEKEDIVGLETQYSELDKKLKEKQTVGQKVKTYYSTLEKAIEHKHNLETLLSQLNDKNAEVDPYAEQVAALRATAIQEITYDEMNELTVLKDHQEFLYKLLTSKDSFIRKKIIDQNIAYLNHRLSYYIEKIGLPHRVKFANDLSVEITTFGKEIDFDNLSRGERNRLILSLSFAFRDIYESLNRPMNLMCIDELIDSGLDAQGIENALAILKDMNRTHNKSILLISHKEELVGRVNSVLMVIKEGGFTSYSTEMEYVEGIE